MINFSQAHNDYLDPDRNISGWVDEDNAAYEWLLDRGGLAPASVAEEEFYRQDLMKVAEEKVIGETLHWILKEVD